MSAESDAAAAAGALRAAAKIIDRMRRIGETPYNQLGVRQKEEYHKYSSYNGDTARWLRDLADRTAQITANREYGVAIRHVNGHWIMPSGRGIGDAWHDAHAALEDAMTSGRASAHGVSEAKVVSRTKAGAWEDEA